MQFLLPVVSDENDQESSSKLDNIDDELIKDESFPKVAHLKMGFRLSMDDYEARHHLSKAKVMFNTALGTMLTAIIGPHGIGKTTFLTAFGEKVRIMARQNRSCNVTILKTKSKSSNAERFSVWKSVVRSMLSELALYTPQYESIAGEVKFKSFTGDVEEGANFAIEKLLPEMQCLKPLLGAINIIGKMEDTQETKMLTGTAKIAKIAELLCAVIQVYTKTTEKMAIVLLDDLQNIDNPSLFLLRELYTKNTGLVILATYRSLTLKKRNSISCPHTAEELFTAFEGSGRFLRLKLKELDEPAIVNLVSKVFNENKMHSVPQIVYTTVFEMSGGNPLYAYELVKELVEAVDVLENVVGSNTDSTQKVKEEIQLIVTKIQELRTKRIEEVICYRFDQLDAASQLLLKMASVICSNSSLFTMAMLSYMIESKRR